MAEYIDESAVLQRALDTYGSALQIVVTIEEMSELQKELCKYLRGKHSPASIAEEIADVEIMLEQMKMLFCCADDVRSIRRRKVERLKERIDNCCEYGGTITPQDYCSRAEHITNTAEPQRVPWEAD